MIKGLTSTFNFDPSPETQATIEMARNFTRDHIIPKASPLDQSGEYPLEIMKKAHSLGLMNFFIPPQYGGSGLSYVDSLLVHEELSYGCTGVSATLGLSSLSGSALLSYGSEDQRKKYFQKFIEKPTVAAFCITESNAGSDVGAIRTRADRNSAGAWTINGEKAWITNAGYADWFFVLARTDPNAKPSGALTAFIVDKDTPGIKVGRKEDNLGQRCADTRSVSFEDVRVSDSAVLGGVGNGFKITMGSFDYQRPILAINAVGLARRAMEESIKYASQRIVFQQPIAKQQAIQFKLAEMAIGIETARLAALKAAWCHMKGEQNTLIAAIAKCLAADTANKAATEAVQIFGGCGYSKDYPVEKLLRDAKIFQIYGGTCEIQRIIIAREVIKNSRDR
ncbi:medium-chain specific acyl-CoA dehydrogenase, mitochondrial-like isoform X2 [Brevipalpus obovatus]|uniref:medium-chain specific acyl-CoA dehydrogenase, mitochondrial-like isoform X2 n=1 Tax=Brevipalpus obovatus TaxID=246614 RepID=UPI003D9F6189